MNPNHEPDGLPAKSEVPRQWWNRPLTPLIGCTLVGLGAGVAVGYPFGGAFWGLLVGAIINVMNEKRQESKGNRDEPA